jgi:hypothetical protein
VLLISKEGGSTWLRRTTKCSQMHIMQAVEVAAGDVVPANPDLLDEMDDLTRLSFLNEPSILNNLLCRFKDDSIYTAAGSVLVAINPFRPVTTSPHSQKLYGLCRSFPFQDGDRIWASMVQPCIRCFSWFTKPSQRCCMGQQPSACTCPYSLGLPWPRICTKAGADNFQTNTPGSLSSAIYTPDPDLYIFESWPKKIVGCRCLCTRKGWCRGTREPAWTGGRGNWNLTSF